MSGGAEYNVPVGPIHAALEEPVLFNFKVDGERVVDVEVVPGQNHRGVEWMGMQRNPVQVVYLAEKICGICTVCHAYSFSRAVEHISGIESTPRADYIRAILAELERIHSHILWAGIAAHEIGFDSLLHYTWKLREKSMDLREMITGNRVHYDMFMIGGVRRDVKQEHVPAILEALKYYKEHFEKLGKFFLQDKVIKMRTQGVGILTKEDALKLCACGPTARASGVPKDVRQDQPFGAYLDIPVKAITPDALTGEVHGDVYDRIIVRLLEVKQSIEIIEECLKKIPDGPILAEPNITKLLIQLKKATGEGIGRHEAPRGEVYHYVRMDSAEKVTAWKVRAPTFANVMPWVPMLKGQQIADIPIVAASTDPCMSCTDRAVVVRDGEKPYMISGEELHRMSVEKTRRMAGMRNVLAPSADGAGCRATIGRSSIECGLRNGVMA
ncbi:MAG: NADH dehydrogenase subunit [Thermoplasmata archaeon HGW-Thermoplasmata-2]|nr:MAG: NADH dehydrogenase subunit [Thermoplasmata archaeon HGW-Thermoplasmata-2]